MPPPFAALDTRFAPPSPEPNPAVPGRETGLGGHIRQLFGTASGNGNTAQPPVKTDRPSRLKLWQMQEKLLCPVVGSCLPMRDLAALCGRFGLYADRGDEFSLHAEAIRQVRSKTPFAIALQKFLDRRYQTTLKTFESASHDEAVLALWRQHLRTGNVAGALWAAATHPASRAETWNRIYGDIHMLSHQMGAGQIADVRRMAALEEENSELRHLIETLRQEQARRETHWQERLRIQRDHSDADQARNQEILTLKACIERYESGEAMLEIGRKLMTLSTANEHLLVLAAKARQYEQEIKTMKETLENVRRERDTLAAEREALESLLLEDDSASCDSRCEERDCPVAGREQRILCVGGRSQLLGHYRRLAQRLGIRLIHHDGGEEESLSRLPDMINGADAVICPTDCVSHPAYYRIKNQCKRLGKPCLMFKGAGVSSFAAALVRISAGEQTLGKTDL